MKPLLPIAAALLLNLLAPKAFGQAPEHAGSASHSLEFIENKGQWEAPVRYAAPLSGGRLFAEADGLTFALLADGGPARQGHGGHPSARGSAPANQPVRGHALTLHFEGAGPATLTAETPTAERRSYFLGADPRRWAADVRGYRELHYAGLWPGVSARVYESADQHLEYDFELAPGAKPASIALRHDGADALTLDGAGNLLLKTSVGTVVERAPQAWQTTAAGQRQAVPCRYVLAGKTAHFALGQYDPTRPLIIDPVVVFATYTGSFSDNWGFTATYDGQGNLYSGGIVFGPGYPASPGAFQTTFAALIDIAIIKYNTSASGPAARVWATYIGGNGPEFPHSLVVNNQGELLLLGSSGSNNYPTTSGALQRTFGGGTPASPFGGFIAPFDVPNGSDLVITRLNTTGTGLVGSTYLGGSGNDGILPLDPNLSPTGTTLQLVHNYGDPFRGDILVDAADNVYIASNTGSGNFPVAGGFNGTFRGGTSDGVVCKLTPGLTALTWSSYLGGSGADAVYSIQLEPGSGDVYVAGGTTSPNFPVTPGAYRTNRPGNVDGFVARIAASGASLSAASYVGTAAYDQAFFLQIGTDGGVYLLGQTLGAFPVTPGLYNTPNGSQFIQKLNPTLDQSQLAMVFGSTAPLNVGRLSISPTAFLVDRCDRVYVCGWGGNVNMRGQGYTQASGTTSAMPVTPGAVQTVTDGSDFYLGQFSAGLTALSYGTYYGDTTPGTGGEHVDGGTSRFDPRGIVYQAVCSCNSSSSGFPIPPGANTYSPTNPSGNCNNAAFVFNFQPNIANAGADQVVCATAGPQPLVGTPGGGTWVGPGVSGSVATGFVFTPSVALTGVQTLVYTVLSTGLCTTTDTRRVTVGAPAPVVFTPLLQTTYCLPAPGTPPLPAVALSATPLGGTFSGPGVSGNPTTGYTFSPNLAPGTVQLTYTVNTNGCPLQASQTVTIANTTSAGPNQSICTDAGPLALTGASPAGGTWTGPGVSGSVATGFVFTPSVALVGPQTLTYSVGLPGLCSNTATRRITVVPLPVVSFTPLPLAAYCVSPFMQPLPPMRLTATPTGGIFSGPGVTGDTLRGYFFTPGVNAGTFTLVYTVRVNGCVGQATQQVTATSIPAPTLPADTVLCPGSGPVALRGQPAGGTFTGTGVSGSAATGFVFTPPASFPSPVVLTYSLSNGSCTGTATRRVSVAAVPQLAPAWAPVACAETRLAPLTVRFGLGSASNAGPVVWEFGDGQQSTDMSPVHTYATPGTYQPRVRVRYNLGRCETSAPAPPVDVVERKVPNIITPNGDNQNQTFRLGPDCAPRLVIFSRWGQQVFEAATYHDDWSAPGLPNGTYYYLATYPDGHRLKGWVEVVR